MEEEDEENGDETRNKGLVANPKALSLARQLMSNQNSVLDTNRRKLESMSLMAVDTEDSQHDLTGDKTQKKKPHVKVQFKQ